MCNGRRTGGRRRCCHDVVHWPGGTKQSIDPCHGRSDIATIDTQLQHGETHTLGWNTVGGTVRVRLFFVHLDG